MRSTEGRPWHTVPLIPGKLFIVGDSKQSIYRFRRADIGVTHLVRESGQLRPLTLTENRRSQKPVLEWVNALFSQIMTGEPGLQAEYVPLQLNPGLQRNDLESSVHVFGEPMDLSAEALRRRQARAKRDTATVPQMADAPVRAEIDDAVVQALGMDAEWGRSFGGR